MEEHEKAEELGDVVGDNEEKVGYHEVVKDGEEQGKWKRDEK